MLFTLLNGAIVGASEYSTPGSKEVIYYPGNYTITCRGAQGGNAFKNSQVSSTGGKGAQAKGTMNIGEITTFYLVVGGKGNQESSGGAKGGFNGGGNAGIDTGGLLSGNDGGGSGGGASDVRTSQNDPLTRILVAAGGSGAADEINGADGGADKPLKRENRNLVEGVLDQQLSSGIGGNGLNHVNTPGSGGGGGFYGGPGGDGTWASTDHNPSVGHSGCSYISQAGGYFGFPARSITFKDGDVKDGRTSGKTGDGSILVQYSYLPYCKRSANLYECDECESSTYFLKEGECKTQCGSGYHVSGSNCVKCEPGSYNNQNHVLTCSPCDENTFANISGLDKCYNCPPRHLSHPGAEECTPPTREFTVKYEIDTFIQGLIFVLFDMLVIK